MPKNKSRSIQKSILRDKTEKVPVDFFTLPHGEVLEKHCRELSFKLLTR
jgi:hypothetical protein